MTDENIYELMPVFAMAHNIYKNRLEYCIKNPHNIPFIHESMYLVKIYEEENLSQDDVTKIFGQSKGTIAKHLRTLEDEGYIIRETDDTNRRKYILKTTKKGDELAILRINELNDWNEKAGIAELDKDFMEKLRNITQKSEEIVKNLNK